MGSQTSKPQRRDSSFAPLVNGLSRFLPPPRFLTMPGIGLDISDHAVRYLELSENRSGERAIGRFGMENMAEGMVVGGEVRDKSALVKLLTKLREKEGIDYVHASLPDEKAYIFQTRISSSNKEENDMRTAIEFRMEENIPLSPRDSVFDYEVVGSDRDELLINAVAIPKAISEQYLEVLRDSGMVPLSFDMEAGAMGRALLSNSARESGLIVDLGSKKTSIMVIAGDTVRFTTVIDIGSDRLTEALAKHLSISNDEAESFKITNGFVPTKKNKKAFEVMVNVVSVLRDEINKYLLYWNTHKEDGSKSPPIERILLCGGGANLDGLVDYMSAYFNFPVLMADAWVNCFDVDEYLPEISRAESMSYVTAVGLALRALARK